MRSSVLQNRKLAHTQAHMVYLKLQVVNVYWNDKVAKAGQPMPVVIWLHPFAFNRGYSKFSHLTMFLFFHFVSLLDMCVVFLQLIMNTAPAPFFVLVIDVHTHHLLPSLLARPYVWPI